MKKSQVERVKSYIERTGSITRNLCLEHHITRLSAIIYTLEKKYGMIFKTEENANGTDYKYSLIK
jgi:hypothetical protein